MSKILLISFLFSFGCIASDATDSGSLKAELTSVFEANEKLHSAFFDYDNQKGEIPKLATDLSGKIDKISDAEVKKLLEFAKTKLGEMKADGPRKENDERYHIVSSALIHVLKKQDMGDTWAAYSCPMVKKKWIQNTQKMAKVHNPYAPQMPHCGGKE